MKENLPSRVFYSLADAAKILECTTNDLIHFANIGFVNLSAYIETIDNQDGELLIYSPSKIDGESLDSDICTLYGLSLINEKPDELGCYQYAFRALRGVFYISALNLLDMEFNEDIEDVLTMFIAPRPLEGGAKTYIPNTIEQRIKVKRKNLCIHVDDLFNFNKSPIEIPAGILSHREKPPTLTVHQFNMMYALLRVAGLSDDEITKESPGTINKKLGQVGARLGINMPTPDKNTWDKWREKFNR